MWRVSGDPDFRPYCFRGANGQPVGLDVEYSRLLGDRVGARMEWVDAGSWAEVLRRYRAGEIDVLMGTAHSAERDREMLFTGSYAGSPVAVIMRLDSPFLVTLQDLRKLRLAGTEGSVTTEYMRRLRPDLPMETFPGVGAAAEAVSSGRADAMVESLVSSASTVRALGLENLKVAGIVDMRFDLRIAVRPDWPEARDLLDQAIAADPPEVRAERFDRWLGVVLGLQHQAWRWRGLYRAGLLVASLLLAAGLTVAIWNRVLRRRVNLATSALRAQMASRLESEERFRTMFEQAPIGMFRSTPDGRFLSVNRRLATLFEWESPERMVEDVNRSDIAHALFQDPARRAEIVREVLEGRGRMITREVRYLTRGGHQIDTLLAMGAVEDPVERTPTLLGFVQDVTERKRQEAGREHREKLLALGQLAGGVAHDFNNLLTSLRSYSQMLAQDAPRDPCVQEAARGISEAVEIAAGVTRRLVQFAHRGSEAPVPYDAHESVRSAVELFAAGGGRQWRVEQTLAAPEATVRGSTALLQNAVLNLLLNARDAMAPGGSIRLASEVLEIRAGDAEGWAPAPAPGRYLLISVADAGAGMDPETLAVCCQPFFTTKGEGGTGLGLPAVQSTAIEHEGAMKVESAPGRGTTVRLLLRLFPASGRPGHEPARLYGAVES